MTRIKSNYTALKLNDVKNLSSYINAFQGHDHPYSKEHNIMGKIQTYTIIIVYREGLQYIKSIIFHKINIESETSEKQSTGNHLCVASQNPWYKLHSLLTIISQESRLQI